MKNGGRRIPRTSGRAVNSAAAAAAIEAARVAAAGRGGDISGPADDDSSPLTVVEPIKPAIPISKKARAKARSRRSARRFPVEKVIKESQYWLDIISKGNKLTSGQKKRIIKETVKSFSTYFNTGFLAYRKS